MQAGRLIGGLRLPRLGRMFRFASLRRHEDAVGPHQLTITVQPDVVPNDAFTFLWAGVLSGNYAETGVPHLIAGGIPAENYGLRPDITSLYDGVVRTMVTALQADGMYVQFAATHDVLMAYTDYVDILSPMMRGTRRSRLRF